MAFSAQRPRSSSRPSTLCVLTTIWFCGLFGNHRHRHHHPLTVVAFAWQPSSQNPHDIFRVECPVQDDTTLQRYFQATTASSNSIGPKEGNELYQSEKTPSSLSFWAAVYKRTQTQIVSLEIQNNDEYYYDTNRNNEEQYSYYSTSSSFSTESMLFVPPANQKDDIPIAIGRLGPAAKEFPGRYLLDCWQCRLPKEKNVVVDEFSPEGETVSEHTMALEAVLDALLERHLSRESPGTSLFEGAIRTKATLVSAPLLERRGFVPIEELQSDMTTHISSLDACLHHYASSKKNHKKSSRLVSLLGSLDRNQEYEQAKIWQDMDSQQKEDFNPWGNFNTL